jgi:lysophospholipase L1-like esterase
MRVGNRAVLIVIAVAAAACGSNPAPTPTPVIPDAPSVSCPADVSLIQRTGQPPVSTHFETPVVKDGQAPVTVACAPGSGSEFPLGTTTVTCEATDALSRKGSCTFAVAVNPVPRLEKTKFLAFGDSITEGKVGGPDTLRSAGVILPGNYAERLETKLRARYEEQTITMVNEGFGGEPTIVGGERLEELLKEISTEALLLLEGTNDMLDDTSPAQITSTVEELRDMVRDGKLYGLRVFVATLPPMKLAPNVFQRSVDAVPVLNDRIRMMAQQENVTLVDLYAALPPSLIGSDGKHPTPNGYQKMADTFFDAIKATLEVKTSTGSQSLWHAPGSR